MDLAFWIAYILASAAVIWHTYTVFSLSDPWPVALISALAVEGFLTLTMAQLGMVFKKNRAVNFLGIGLFVIVSGLAQVIARFHGLGIELPEWLRFVSLGLVPVATTGSLVMLGIIRYYSNHHPADTTNPLVNTLSKVDKQVEQVVETVRRGPGRPRKEVYASEVESNPKVSKTPKK